MGRIYVAEMESVAVSTQRSLVEVTAPSDAILRLIEAWISQDGSETSTQEVASIVRKSAAGTGTAFTARLLNPSDAAFGGTCRTNMSAEGTLGDELRREGFNILNGWFYVPVPEARIVVAPSGILAVRFAVAPAASINISAGMIFEEIG